MLLKRVIDAAFAAMALLALMPVLLCVALWIKLDSPGPALFRQVRIGRGGRPFRIYKFRTMIVGASRGSSLTLGDDARITPLGRMLRRHKLDELPQLINVLFGDMAFVGPRPEVPDLMANYTPAEEALICSVRPGLSDYASLVFRDEGALLKGQDDPRAFYQAVIMPIKLALIERYLRDIGLVTDLRIAVATIAVLVTGRLPRGLALPVDLTPATPRGPGQPAMSA